MTKAIVISGKAGAGKDTLAELFKKQLTEQDQRVLVIHYADLLKFICTSFFGWNGDKDEAGRSLLQRVGTDVVRKTNPDYWVDFIVDMIEFFPDAWDYVVIPDCRFPNEIECLKARGIPTLHVRIVRDGDGIAMTDEQKAHPSETALDDVRPDYIVHNNGSIEDLYKNVTIKAK